ncbi:MAG: BACON domain-containing protein [Prevotellaceae bacterium]|jgi:hypothetical protein|nr:BACON domain-containing protein [Prevotellaceae bacterium]
MKKSIYLFSMLLFLLATAAGCSDKGEELELDFLELESANVSFDAFGGDGEIIVKSTAGVTASVAAAWCTPAVSGNKVTVAVSPYGGLLGRATVVTLVSAGKTVQVPVAQSGMDFKLETNIVRMPSTAGDATMPLHCPIPVMAQCSATWLTINVTAGNVLELQAEANPNRPRTGLVTLTAGDLTLVVKVMQDGDLPSPLIEWFATMDTYGYLRAGSNSAMVVLERCATALNNALLEDLRYIIVGNSPFNNFSGRGFIFGSYSYLDRQTTNVQFLYTFKAEGKTVAITYSEEGYYAEWYHIFYASFLDAITNKSPYYMTPNDFETPTEIVLTSVADPDFYLVINDFGK